MSQNAEQNCLSDAAIHILVIIVKPIITLYTAVGSVS